MLKKFYKLLAISVMPGICLTSIVLAFIARDVIFSKLSLDSQAVL